MRTRYNFHGDPERFPKVADLISRTYRREIRYIADVAGGQGMLAKLLRNRFGYDAEVVDPRGWRIKGVPGREEEFDPDQAGYYDLIVGVHPDQATRAVAVGALYTRTLLVPCCNFWDRSKRMGTTALVESIEQFYRRYGVRWQRVQLDIRGPKNIALLTEPPPKRPAPREVLLPPYHEAEGQLASRGAWLVEKRLQKRDR
ncbi:MAG: hypothetical protein ACE149_17965 [Armatimonadota bacterium]